MTETHGGTVMPSSSPANMEPDAGGLQRRLTESEQRARRLHGELQHRVRHVVAVIGVVARRTAEITGGVEDYAQHLDGRIGAISRSQNLALRDPFGTVDLHHLIAEELLAHAAVEGEQLSLCGPAVGLAGRGVGAIWLAIHELAVNAVKFGALSTRDGRIAIAWQPVWNGRTHLRLQWAECHRRPIPAGRRTGFGTDVIERMLAEELGATGALSFTPSGIDCQITLPISEHIRLQPADQAC